MSGEIGRREVVTVALVSLVLSILGIRSAQATPQSVQTAINKLIGRQTARTGKIFFDLPPVAEDGNNVLIGLSAESPMTDNDYVKTISLFAEQNPNPRVATFHFSPLSGKAEVITRIRLAGSQKLIAVAEMSDGSMYIAKKGINVTIGGCGTSN